MRRRFAVLLTAALLLAGGESVEAQFAPPIAVRSSQAQVLPRDPRLVADLERANDLLAAGDTAAAIELYQLILEDSEDTFADATLPASVKRQAALALQTLPAAAKADYERRYGPAAAALLAEAQLESNAEAYGEILRRYPHTEASHQAAVELAQIKFDHGSPLAAARLLQALPPAQQTTEVLSLTVAAWWQAGFQRQAIQTVLSSENGRRLIPRVPENPAALTETVVRSWASETFGTRRVDAVASPEAPIESAAFSPLRIPEWQAPLLEPNDHFDRRLADRMLAALDDVLATLDSETEPPAPEPIAVGDTLVVPTYGRLKAFDLNTGRLLWKSFDVDETIVDFAQPHEAPHRQDAAERLEALGELFAHLATTDRTQSTITTDGRRVFVISGSLVSSTSGSAGAAEIDLSPVNRLKCYDVVSGKLLWEAGGARGRHQLPLAGTFFLGPPLAVDNELYCLGEESGQVRLSVLSAQTGAEQWSQAIANPLRALSGATSRPYLGLQPAAQGDIVVCAGGSGLVIAVDRLQRTLLWSAGYLDERLPANVRTPANDTTARGLTPVLGDGLVLVKPPDSPDLVCLDLLTGDQRWQQPADSIVSLAGVHDRVAVALGAHSVRSFRLDDGEAAWPEVSLFGAGAAGPGGRGVLRDGILTVPLTTGELASIDVTQGRLLTRSPPAQPTPANLIVANQRLIAQSRADLQVYGALPDVQRRIESLLAADSRDATGLALRGELRLHRGDVDSGLSDLRAAYSQTPTDSVRHLLITTQLEQLRTDFAANRDSAEELRSLVGGTQHESDFTFVYAAGLEAAGEYLAAFDEYMRLTDEILADANSPIQADELQPISVGHLARIDRRVLARLTRLSDTARVKVRERMIRELRRRAGAIVAEPADQIATALRIFGIKPVDRTLRTALAAKLLDAGDPSRLLEAELHLLAALESSQHETRVEVTRLLARLYRQSGAVEAFATQLSQLEGPLAGVTGIEGLTGAAAARELRNDLRTETLLKQLASWDFESVDAELKYRPQTRVPLWPVQPLWPQSQAMNGWTFRVDPAGRVVSLTNADGLPLGELSTGSPGVFAANGAVAQSGAGHLAMLLLSDRFLLLSTLGAAPRQIHSELLIEDQTLPRGRQPTVSVGQGIRTQLFEDRAQRRVGRAALLSPHLLCYQVGEELVAIEPVTQRVLWKTQQPIRGCEMFGDERYVILKPPRDESLLVYSAIEGTYLGERPLPEAGLFGNQGIDPVRGHSLLVWERDGNRSRYGLFDPVRQRYVWQFEGTTGARPTITNTNRLLIMEPSGQVVLIEPETGEVLFEVGLPTQPQLGAVAAIDTEDSLIVMERVYGMSTPAPFRPIHNRWRIVNGQVYAMEKSTGDVRWSTRVEKKWIDLSLPGNWPVLSFAARMPVIVAEQPQQATMQLDVLVVDKIRGDVLFQEMAPEPQNDTDWRADVSDREVFVKYGSRQLSLDFLDAFESDPPATPSERSGVNFRNPNSEPTVP